MTKDRRSNDEAGAMVVGDRFPIRPFVIHFFASPSTGFPSAPVYVTFTAA
jgi:hypothetical protein